MPGLVFVSALCTCWLASIGMLANVWHVRSVVCVLLVGGKQKTKWKHWSLVLFRMAFVSMCTLGRGVGQAIRLEYSHLLLLS